MWTLEERQNRQDLIEVFKMYKGFRPTRLSIDELFERDANIKGTRRHTLRLKEIQSVRDVRRYFFSQRVVNRWNSLHQETADVSSINSLKGRLDKIRKTRMGFLWILHGPQSPRPHGGWIPVRPHNVSYKVSIILYRMKGTDVFWLGRMAPHRLNWLSLLQAVKGINEGYCTLYFYVHFKHFK